MSTTTRDEIIAEEQKAVDRAYDCYEKRLAELSGGSIASASASGKDSVANRKDAEDKAAEYAGLGDASLVVSRVDTRDGPDGKPDTWYVGRRAVSDVETRDTVVVLWTTPLAKKWSKTLPGAPGEMLLRRQLRCTQRVVNEYVDEISVAVPSPRPTEDEADPQTAATDPTSVVPQLGPMRPPVLTPSGLARLHRKKPQPLDDFLLRELQRSRSGSMRDIVETIRRDQMDLVTDSPADILVVQGGPGTGKSAVGLHRVTWLVNNGHFKAQDILVVGPHERFLEYVGQVLPTLGTRNVNAVQVSRLWDGEIRGTDTPRARLVKSDDRIADVLRRRVEHECRPEAIDEFTTTPSYKDAKPELAITAGSTTLRIPRSEILALLQEAREGDGSYRERRDHFRSLLVDRLLQELASLAPRRSQGETIRRDLERNRQVGRLIERVWPSPSSREALRSLYDSPELLRTCADGFLDAEEQEALHRPKADKTENEPWTLDDHVCLEELRHLITGETPRRYGHIVADEAQDLTPMQARSLRRRIAVNGSMTVLGDLAQATGPHTYTDWDRLGTLLSDHGDWRIAELNTSYRVPAEIMTFVAPLAHTIAPSLPYPQAVREAGAASVRTLPAEPWTLLDDTVAQTTRLVGTHDGHTLRSVAVIVPDDSGWLDEINRHLNQTVGLTDEQRAAVSVLAAAQAKGMEYDHVLVVEPATIADRGPAGLRQLYVALTRSTQSLTVLHTSPLPKALAPSNDTVEPAPASTEPSAAGGDLPDIGTDLRIRVIGPGPGGRYKVTALSPAVRHPLVLAVRHGAASPRPGDELDCWVFAHESTHCLLTADQRGRQPISPRMAPRYTAALGVLDELIRGEGIVAQDARDRLSELKGMANRVLRRDQADWVDVRRVLGSPDRHRLTLLRDLAAHTHRALKDGHLDADRLKDDLERAGWADALLTARHTLQQRLAAADPQAASGTTPAAAPHTSEPKDPDAMPAIATDTTVPTADASPSLLQALQTAATADRTCKTHEAVRLELMAALLRADLQPTNTPVIDVSCTTKDGHFLYEVLGANRCTYADLRSGAVRLLEINHTLPTPADRLHLILCQPPAEDWTADTLHGIFKVHVLWRTKEGWSGKDTETALSTEPT
ncbi:AAA family ATPase [Streptomyces mirabilis]|uniref:AAA family ATPase n=1 Tax=Streptomyces mirabilis TaxID=68239 RepID=UPI00225B740D|nr:AAA family ATPase [Streptomyces mirabilis]MCX4617846.1 AAA family ATPase [Streptomyces mirabilis]